MAQFGFAAACGFEPSSCEAVCMQVQMEALVMEGSDSSLVPLPEFKPNRCAGQLPSLRVLRARKVAREAACQSERDISNTRMLKTDDVGRHKFICVGPVRTSGQPQISRMKKQQTIPSVVFAGAAILGLRSSKRNTSEPPPRMAGKRMFICPEYAKVDLGKSSSRMAHNLSLAPRTVLAPVPPAMPRTRPGGRRCFNQQVLHLAATVANPA